jgi:hypothetical protein
VNSSRSERKCALMLSTLAPADQRQLLAGLPAGTAGRVRTLLGELRALRLPMADLAQALLADEVAGLTSETSLDVNQLMGLAAVLPDAWYARVLAAWGEVDRSFCVSLLERSRAASVGRELSLVASLPPRLTQALKAEAVLLAAAGPRP